MILWKLLPLSRRAAFVYLLAIGLLFLVHFKIADDFTYRHTKHFSDVRCRFGCFRDTEFYKLFSLDTHPAFYSRLTSANQNSQNGPQKLSESEEIDEEDLPVSKRRFEISEKIRQSAPIDMTEEKDVYDNSEHDTNNYPNATHTTKSLYEPPVGETPVRRFPLCVIIGFTKCGTRALIEFLSLHPYIRVARNEVHFYDKDEFFDLGYDWYKKQMPLSYSNQVTLEKTPAYVLTPRARDEMYRITPNVKLIMLVRDPVVRLVSQYILRFRLHKADDEEMKPVSAIYTNFSTGKFDPDLRPVDIGNYQKHINMWLKRFPIHQMLIINSEDLTRNPLVVIKRVETFLKIPNLFSESNVFYNKTSGFYCPGGFAPFSSPRCLGKTKGLMHPKLQPEEKRMLYEYYKPFNEKLFNIIGYKMNWTEKQWGKEEE